MWHLYGQRPWLLGSNLLTLLFLFYFKSMFTLFLLWYSHMKMNKRQLLQSVVSSVKSFWHCLILYLISEEEKHLTHEMGVLYKYIAYYQHASVSEELRDKWHVYNYPSTTSISFKLLSVLKSRENVKVLFIKFQKLHMQKVAVSWVLDVDGVLRFYLYKERVFWWTKVSGETLLSTLSGKV